MKTIDDLVDAVEEGELEEVKSILDENPQMLDEVTRTGFAPIHGAVHQELEDVVEYLIGRGADVNNWGGNQETPLHIAAGKRSVAIVQALIEHGAELDAGNTKNQGAKTPLNVAASELKYYRPEHSQAIVDLLVAAGAFVDANSAVLMNDNDRLRTLINENPDLNSLAALNRNRLLVDAAESANDDAAQILLGHGLEPCLEALNAVLANVDYSKSESERLDKSIKILRMYLSSGASEHLNSTSPFESRTPYEYATKIDKKRPESKLLELVNSHI